MSAIKFGDLLRGIQDAVASAGGTAQQEALGKLAAAVSDLEDNGSANVVSEMSAAAERAGLKPWQRRLMELQAAELDQVAFVKALDVLKADRSIKKADLLRIAEGFSGSVDKKASADKLIKSIESAFYERVYERDANAMARRATPW